MSLKPQHHLDASHYPTRQNIKFGRRSCLKKLAVNIMLFSIFTAFFKKNHGQSINNDVRAREGRLAGAPPNTERGQPVDLLPVSDSIRKTADTTVSPTQCKLPVDSTKTIEQTIPADTADQEARLRGVMKPVQRHLFKNVIRELFRF
ncbi:MAG: hypothetical protein JW795_19625 [Chitinivibrionales bacterium]|nr:hypothetical protein [Chitinivibrionales bacterium]